MDKTTQYIIDQFINDLTPEDTGRKIMGNYILRYEGFTDDCNKDYRDKNQTFEQVYDQVIDEWNLQEGSKALETNLAGTIENPIIWALYEKDHT